MSSNKLLKRLFAWGMSRANSANLKKVKVLNSPTYNNFGEVKQQLLGNLQGRVVEIGPGTGANLSYYPKSIEWIGIEPNLYMHSYLKKEGETQGLQDFKVQGVVAESLPLDTDSIDIVVSTHVLCSVKSLDNSLKEIKRILKPGGKFIFLEHVAADGGTLTRKVQNGIEPVWKNLFDNCRPNREIWKAIEGAGFAYLDYQHFQLSVPIVSPHIAGIAINY